MFPRIAGSHSVGGALGSHTHVVPGKWYQQMVKGVDHADIVALPEPARIGSQKRFYTGLFERLVSL